MSLQTLVEKHNVVVCVGSGGVGKTTTSAAIAMTAAMAGKRVLCLTIDPAKRLANSLGLERFEESEQRVAPELFEAQGLTCKGELSAMMLDMKSTFDDLVRRYAKNPQQRDRILNNQLYRYVSTSLAGTQEYMAMEKLHSVRGDADYDLIVLDTPPTTNALDFLEAPQKLVGAIDSPMMRWFVETFEGGTRVGLLGKSTSFVLKGLAKFTGAEFLDLVAEFVVELNALFGGFRERAQAVYDDLRGEEVAFVIVTSPNPSTVAEAIYFGRKLQDYGIAPRGLVVNRVHHAPPPDPAHSTLLNALTPYATEEHATSLLPKMQQAGEAARAFAHRDQEGIRRIREQLASEIDYTEIPAFDKDVHDLAALARLSTYFA